MTFVQTIVQRFTSLSKPRRDFLLALHGALLCMVGRATMLNLSRFGAGSPRRLARHFATKLDWATLNWTALAECGITEHRLVACLDATFLPKSGKHTYGVGWFHHGAHNRSEKGCEAIHLGVVDMDDHTAYTLAVAQTPATCQDALTRIDFYTDLVCEHAPSLLSHGVTHLACDAAFSKHKFVSRVTQAGLHMVGKIRKDSHLRYLYHGEHPVRRGRKTQFDGRVDLVALSRFSSRHKPTQGRELWWCDVNSPCFKTTIRVVVVREYDKPISKQRILFSTDISLDPEEIVSIYSARFQQEFIFRDGKQHMGFADGQMRDQTKRHFHLNASLWALNVVRLEDREAQDKQTNRVMSLASHKRRATWRYAGARILSMSGHEPDPDQLERVLDELAYDLDFAA
jgi:hypothetical protein